MDPQSYLWLTSQMQVTPVPKVRLYHYTNLLGKQGIEKTGRIVKAEHYFGDVEGVFFSGLMVDGSTVTKEMMAVLNWGTTGKLHAAY